MKKLLLTLLVLSSSLVAFSQGKWSPRTSLPDSTRDGAVGFAIGNYGYMGLGQAPGKTLHPDYKDFWRFDPSTDSWTRMADFPGLARGFAATFVIGNYGYVVTGSDSNLNSYTNQCWQYNAVTNKWVQKANFAGRARSFGVGFAIGAKGYVGLGSPNNYHPYKDFWAYDTGTNAWTQIANFGGLPRITSSGFSVDGTGYVCFGEDSTSSFHRDIWAYNPGTNSWTQKSNCPDTDSYAASGFVIGKDIFIGTGQDSTSLCLSQFWEYNTVSNTWTKQVNFPDIRCASSAFSIGDTGYLGLGVNLDTSFEGWHNDLYRFLPDSTLGIDNLTKQQQPLVFPNPFNNYCTIEILNSTTQNFKITCYDLLGREQEIYYSVSSGNNVRYIKVYRGGLPDGTYIIKIDYENKENNVKIALEAH
jgi:N-acetylneuraminic acid mutarotase